MQLITLIDFWMLNQLVVLQIDLVIIVLFHISLNSIDPGKLLQRASEQGPEVPTSKPRANASRQAWPSLGCSLAADSGRSQAKTGERGGVRPGARCDQALAWWGNVISHPGPRPSIHGHPGLGPLRAGWSRGISPNTLSPSSSHEDGFWVPAPTLP